MVAAGFGGVAAPKAAAVALVVCGVSAGKESVDGAGFWSRVPGAAESAFSVVAGEYAFEFAIEVDVLAEEYGFASVGAVAGDAVNALDVASELAELVEYLAAEEPVGLSCGPVWVLVVTGGSDVCLSVVGRGSCGGLVVGVVDWVPAAPQETFDTAVVVVWLDPVAEEDHRVAVTKLVGAVEVRDGHQWNVQCGVEGLAFEAERAGFGAVFVVSVNGDGQGHAVEGWSGFGHEGDDLVALSWPNHAFTSFHRDQAAHAESAAVDADCGIPDDDVLSFAVDFMSAPGDVEAHHHGPLSFRSVQISCLSVALVDFLTCVPIYWVSIPSLRLFVSFAEGFFGHVELGRLFVFGDASEGRCKILVGCAGLDVLCLLTAGKGQGHESSG